jgi:hypothetical protein
MRVWSVHPRFLDSKGLVACWRETLLAKHVLEGKTCGYRNHPQLVRFKCFSEPLKTVNFYLEQLFLESKRRGFNFSEDKFERVDLEDKIPLNNEQLLFEFGHLHKKIMTRNPSELNFSLKDVELLSLQDLQIFVHPLFVLKEGPIEDWEVI